MTKEIQGQLTATGLNIAIVVSRFNNFVTDKLLAGAVERFSRLGGSSANINTVWVPGAFEIPLAAKAVAESGRYDGVVALGAVIRGDTPHFDYVCSEAAKGVSAVMMATGVPIAFGVLTTNNVEQAIERAGLKSGNKGAEAVDAVVEMISVMKQLKE